MVLTNHIDPSYYNSANEYHREMRKQIDEFYAAKNYGKSKGFKVIFGIEVSLHNL